MKQILVGRCVKVEDVPAPGLGSGEVLVEVAWSLISTGTEVAGVESARGGLWATVKEHPQRLAQVLEMIRVNGIRKTFVRVRTRLNAGYPTGYSCAGRVIAVGSRVSGFIAGDLVACAGQGYASHAEVVCVPANLVAKVPHGCDLRAASGATLGAIALQGVRRAQACLGETVAVLGLGLLGQIAIQLLAASGARVIGFDLNDKRVQEAHALGFQDVFALRAERATREVLARTEEWGADATLITAATDAAGICQSAIEMTRAKGRVVVVGAVPLQFEREPFYRREIDFTISCSYGPGRYDPFYEEAGQDYPYAYVRWTENRNLKEVLRLMANGTLRMQPLIAAEYPIEGAQEAFARLRAMDGPRPLSIVLKYDVAQMHAEEKSGRSVAFDSARPIRGKIGLGIIGVGQFFTSTHLPNLAILADRFQIVSVCDKNGVRAQDIARQVGAGEACSEEGHLLANPQVQLVLIATRHDLHAALAMAALRAGKHVFTEKPMAMNAAELMELVETIRGGDRYVMVGFNRRFSPHTLRLRELLAGRTSPLLVTYRVLADPAPAHSWIYSEAGGGRVIGEACHMLDLLNFLVGDEVAEEDISVVASPPAPNRPAGDNFVTTVRYADGSVCTLTYTVLGRNSKDIGKERIEALWDGKLFAIDDFVQSVESGCPPVTVRSKGHREELVALADFLRGSGPTPLAVDASVRATEMALRIDAACRGVAQAGAEGRA